MSEIERDPEPTPVPDETTIGEAKQQIKRNKGFRELLGIAHRPGDIRIHFRWRWPDGKETDIADDRTIGYWRQVTPPAKAVLAIDDGSGGRPVRPRTPELVS